MGGHQRMLRMDQVHVVRQKARVEKLSVRRVASDLGISRNTVRRYLKDETPIGERRAAARCSPVRDAVAGRVLALPSKRCLNARPRQRRLLHNGHVEARLAKLLLEATNRESPRNLNRSLTRRRINSEIHNPSVVIGG